MSRLPTQKVVVSPKVEWWTPLFNALVYVVIAAAVSIALYVEYRDLWSIFVPFGFGLLFVFLDYILLWLGIGFNRVVIHDGSMWLEQYRWHRIVEKNEITRDTAFEIFPVRDRWLIEWLSPANPCFANAWVLPGSPDDVGVFILARTKKQIARFQNQVDEALHVEKLRLGLIE